MTELEKHLIRAGVKNLREFGYPDCTAENILTDSVYSQFFASMLDSNMGQNAAADVAIVSLKAMIASSETPAERAQS